MAGIFIGMALFFCLLASTPAFSGASARALLFSTNASYVDDDHKGSVDIEFVEDPNVKIRKQLWSTFEVSLSLLPPCAETGCVGGDGNEQVERIRFEVIHI